jgi:hypothetical protein
MIDFKYVENRLANLILTNLTVDKKKGIILRFQGLTVKLVNAEFMYNPMLHVKKDEDTGGSWSFPNGVYVVRNVKYSENEFTLSYFMDQLIFKSLDDRPIQVKFIPSITGANSKMAGYYEESALHELTDITVDTFMHHCHHELVVSGHDKNLKQHSFFILAKGIKYPGDLLKPVQITEVISREKSITLKTPDCPINIDFAEGPVDVIRYVKLVEAK